jgi:spore maturation protein CgeB
LKTKIKILHYCEEDFATAWQRTKAFEDIEEFEVVTLWHTRISKNANIFLRIFCSFRYRMKIPVEKNRENKKLIDELKKNSYDVIFIEKCLTIKSKTLKKIKKLAPNIKLVLYILDDFKTRGNNSIFFNKAVKQYDLIATNKKHNIDEYYALKAKKVLYFRNAYSSHVHRPILPNKEEFTNFQSDVTFIGTYERHRANLLLYLAERGLKIHLFGWSKQDILDGKVHSNIINHNKHVYYDDFSRIINSSKINLNFLRKLNRDTETTRTIEIPACGGFMLSEWSEDQAELFAPDIEAAYFDSEEDLLRKVQYFLHNDHERKQIAANGLLKTRQKKMDYASQLKNIVSTVYRDK